MALTTIAGTILTSTGAVPNQGRLIFTRASWDMNSNMVWSASPIEEVLSGSAYSVALESTTDKQIQSAYKVELSHYSAVKRATLIEVLGVIAVPPTGGPFDLPDLLAVPITEPVPADILALCQAYAASTAVDAGAAGSSAAAAAASAANAAFYDGIWFDDLPSVTADTVLSYTAGAGKTLVAPGDYVLTRAEGFCFIVAASGASDHIAINAGGVKFYRSGNALPVTPKSANNNMVAAIAAAGPGGTVYLETSVATGTAPVANIATDIAGQPLHHSPTTGGGRRVQNIAGRDPSLTEFGQENMVRWLEGLRTGVTLKVLLVGDSNTLGHVGAVLATDLASLPNVTVANHGISGTNIEDWRNGTGAFAASGKALADGIAYGPDLIICGWGGTNEPLSGRSEAVFAASLRSALTTLRAALDVNTTSIVLMTANAMNADTGTGGHKPDELYNTNVRPYIMQAADDFTCGFFDKNGKFPNAFADFAAGAMQNLWTDSARVHTTALSRDILKAELLDFLVPAGVRPNGWGWINAKAVTDGPKSYMPGLSLSRGADFPINGWVATLQPVGTGSAPIQFNWGFGGLGGSFQFRHGVGATWSGWQAVGYEALNVLTGLAAGYSLGGGATGANTRRSGMIVNLHGTVTRAAGQVISATVFGTIAAADRPIVNKRNCGFVVENAGGSVEVIRGDVTTAGSVVIRASSVMTDATTVHLAETWRANV
jgi:hypothetical protein